MSKKPLTELQVKKLEDDYYDQMNILNGNHELYNAVSKYVEYLKSMKETK